MPPKKVKKTDKPVVFYAFPSNPPHIGETVNEFAKNLRGGGEYDARTWVDMETAGLRITKQIIRKIEQCDIFGCDLTYLNNNVLFELGYAIAKRKKVFISINRNIEDAHKRYISISALEGVGYVGYSNSVDLSSKFYELKIMSKKYEPLAEQLKLFETLDTIGLFYLKSAGKSEASYRVTEVLQDFPLQNIVDDPEESPGDSLSWYAHNIASCTAFIAHFMSTEQIGNVTHNHKASLISGMAYGYGKPIFLMAHSPFSIPSDLPDLMKVHETAGHAKSIARSWLSQLSVERERVHAQRVEYRESRAKGKNLRNLRLGEYMAENENEDLYKYFVETGAYNEVINGRQTIFIGRKGTGKTANLYAASEHFKADKRNLVIMIKPVGYEVEGLINILNQTQNSETRGFFIESLWKYLLYSEIARSIDNKFKDNLGMSASAKEIDLIEFAADNTEILTESFSERLRKVISDIQIENYNEKEGITLMEYLGIKLHASMIRSLKRKLVPALEKYKTIVILIDNLDKGWTNDVDVGKVSEVLFGLLSVSRQMPEEIRKDTKEGQSINFRITVFLRSDIYIHVLKAARERDKLEVQHIEWSDAEILGRVLDDRLVADFSEKTPPEIWKEFFLPLIGSFHPREFILRNIRPRPRDAIFLLKSAINNSISRGHSRVEEQDILDALKTYSKWVYDSLIDEDNPNSNYMESILYQFINDKLIYSEEEIKDLLAQIVSPISLVEEYFNLLFDSHFLEVEYSPNNFRVVDNPEERKILLIALKKREERLGRSMRFRITKPFHRVLLIEDELISP